MSYHPDLSGLSNEGDPNSGEDSVQGHREHAKSPVVESADALRERMIQCAESGQALDTAKLEQALAALTRLERDGWQRDSSKARTQEERWVDINLLDEEAETVLCQSLRRKETRTRTLSALNGNLSHHFLELKLFATILTVLDKEQQAIEDAVQDEKEETQAKALDALGYLFPHKQNLKERMGEFWPKMVALFEKGSYPCFAVMQKIWEHGLPNDRQAMTEWVVDKTKAGWGEVGTIHQEMRGERAQEFLELVLHTLGMDSAFFMNTWKENSKPGDRDWYYATNLQRILFVQGRNPGAALDLFQTFGITNFGRYSSHMLENLVDQKDDTTHPYVVICLPQTDHNTAFGHHWYAWSKLEESEERLNKNPADVAHLRVIEVGSKADFLKKILELDKRYGAHHKISSLLIGGHGSKDSLDLGRKPGDRGTLRTEDLHRMDTGKLASYFDRDANIILLSCSTGQAGGIAQEMSRVFQCKVDAPNDPTNMESLAIFKHPLTQKPVLGLGFRDHHMHKVYRNGELIY